MDWLSGSARENFILQMIQLPQEQWDALCAQLLNQSGGLSISAGQGTTMAVGQQQSLYLQMQSDTGEEIRWSVDGRAVEIAEEYGTEVVITAVRNGTATVTARMGSHRASIQITVEEGAVSISLSTNHLNLNVGESQSVSASVSPDGDYTYDWRTNGASRALSIDDSSSDAITVTANQKGSYTITLRIHRDGEVVGKIDLPVTVGGGAQTMNLSLSAGTDQLTVGETTTISLQGDLPRGAKVRWETKGAVSGSGTSSQVQIKGDKAGTGTVQVTITADGYEDLTLTLKITVAAGGSTGGNSSSGSSNSGSGGSTSGGGSNSGSDSTGGSDNTDSSDNTGDGDNTSNGDNTGDEVDGNTGDTGDGNTGSDEVDGSGSGNTDGDAGETTTENEGAGSEDPNAAAPEAESLAGEEAPQA